MYTSLMNPFGGKRSDKKDNRVPDGVTVKCTHSLWESFRQYLLQDTTERVAYMLGQHADNTFIITELVLPPDEAYLSRSPGNVCLAGAWVTEHVYNRFGQGTCNAVAHGHSHSFGEHSVCFSGVDTADDLQRLAREEDKLPLAKARFGQPAVVVRSFSFVVDQSSFDARCLERTSGKLTPIQRLVLIGPQLQVLFPSSSSKYRAPARPVHAISQQEACFGNPAREAAANTRVVVDGTGGVGSIAAEMLLRQGFVDVTLVDPDVLETSNLTRFQGADASDVGKPKVEVLLRRLLLQFPHARIKALHTSIYSPAGMAVFRRADIAVCAVDNSAARAFLSRQAVRDAVVLFDCGAQIVSNQQGDAMPVWRLGLVIPGVTACGDCSPMALFDRKRAQEEFLDPLTTRLAKAKGYLSDAPQEQGAAVYAVNLSLVGALGLGLQNLLVPHRGAAHYVSNFIEFDPRYRVLRSGAGARQDADCWVAQVRVPIGHANARPRANCPHCQTRLWGSLDTWKLLHPACSEQAHEPRLPDAKAILQRALAAHEPVQNSAVETVSVDSPSGSDEATACIAPNAQVKAKKDKPCE